MLLNALTTNDAQCDKLPQGTLTQTLAEYFHKYGVKAPPIELTFAFSRHVTADDFNWVEDLYRETDVFIPEMIQWSSVSLEKFEKIAQGNQETKHIVETYVQVLQNKPNDPTKEYSIARIRLMTKYIGKHLCLIDVQEGTELGKQMDVAFALHRMSRKAEAYHNQLQRKRDTLMLLNLAPALGNLIRRFPELAEKEKLKVLLTLGSAHTRMSEPLVKRGENVWVFSIAP